MAGNKTNLAISPLDMSGHAWNLAGINEASDSELYKAGYNYAIANPNKIIGSDDILSMYESNYASYRKLADSESSLISEYKARFKIN